MALPAELFDARAFLDAQTGKGALLGLDPGTKTIGVAISDINWTIASPVTTIRRSKFAHDAGLLNTLIERENVAGLIIGYPYNMDGSSGQRAQSVRAFRRQLSDHVAVPMLFFDERLSSAQAADTLSDAGRSSKQRQELIDAAAAAHILSDAMKALVPLRTV